AGTAAGFRALIGVNAVERTLGAFAAVAMATFRIVRLPETAICRRTRTVFDDPGAMFPRFQISAPRTRTGPPTPVKLRDGSESPAGIGSRRRTERAMTRLRLVTLIV